MVTTGMTSLANLPTLEAIYPFAGHEWLFTVLAAGFLIYFVGQQIAMEKEQMSGISAAPEPLAPEAALAPAE